MSAFRVVLVSAPKRKLARSLARSLVKNKLAACVSEIPRVTSHYRWKGKLEKASETLLVIKTRAALLPKLIRFVKENHDAEVPEIVSLPILEGNPDYLEWVGTSSR